MTWTSVFNAAVFCLLATLLSADDKTYKLEEPADDTRVFGVGMRLQVNGKLQVSTAEKDKVAPLALSVTAALSYRERRLVGLGRDALGLRALREYELTEAKIEVADQTTELKLDEQLKMIVAQGRPEGVEHYSLGGPLTTNDLDLIRAPADSLAFPALLPAKEVAVGESWTPPAWAAQLLAGVEAVTKIELQCTLESVQDTIARIRLDAKLDGATGGAPTKITVQGTLDYDLEAKSISAADLTQTEQRQVGAISPGLDVKARVRLLRKPAKDGGRLTEAKLIDHVATEPAPSAKFLRFDSPWNLSVLHSRAWYMFHQTDKVAIFRLLDQGALIAQCNLSQIASVKPGQHTSEEEFQTDIQTQLGESLDKIESARVIPAKNGRFVFQVVATGTIKGRAMTWIYYLIADPSGRQVSLQFAMDTTLTDHLKDRDRELVDSLRFVPASAALTPTPRKQ